MEPERFSVWCAKSFALIGSLSGTLQDRSIEIRIDRKKRGQKVSPLRATPKEKREEFMRKILRWAADHGNRLGTLDPATLEVLNDRAADNWTPLLQVAALIGQPWLGTAYEAMRALNPQNGEPETETRSENLPTAVLSRLRQVFYDSIQDPAREVAETAARSEGKAEDQIEAEGKAAAEGALKHFLQDVNRRLRSEGKAEDQIEAEGKAAAEGALKHFLQDVNRRLKAGPPKKDELYLIPSVDILNELNADKEAPWADWKKGNVEGLSATKLSGILRPYKVRSTRLKRGAPHGYTLESLLPVFERYLTDAPDAQGSDPL
jgi:hypothetical protein